jgi:hypothetical protein
MISDKMFSVIVWLSVALLIFAVVVGLRYEYKHPCIASHTETQVLYNAALKFPTAQQVVVCDERVRRVQK